MSALTDLRDQILSGAFADLPAYPPATALPYLTQASLKSALKAVVLDLPTAPDGLPPGEPWKQGDAASGFGINFAGTNT